jgi:hypothetical protein
MPIRSFPVACQRIDFVGLRTIGVKAMDHLHDSREAVVVRRQDVKVRCRPAQEDQVDDLAHECRAKNARALIGAKTLEKAHGDTGELIVERRPLYDQRCGFGCRSGTIHLQKQLRHQRGRHAHGNTARGFFRRAVRFALERHRQRQRQIVIGVVVVAFPGLWGLLTPTPMVMVALSVSYMAFFLVILIEILRHLLRPIYINVDLVSAAVCGLFLLLETSIFLMQALYYAIPGSFRGIDTALPTTVYLDLVYFCSIVITSIGFGDITPAHHMTKLATSAVGTTGQMYSVVLVGILISKYTSATAERSEKQKQPPSEAGSG